MGKEWKGGWEKGREVAPAVVGGALSWAFSLITSPSHEIPDLQFFLTPECPFLYVRDLGENEGLSPSL